MPERPSLYAVILVGGKGKRLRPLSTDERPKAFLSITKDRNSMFRNTVRRIARLIPRSQIVVVANAMHGKLVQKDFPGIRKANLVLEPVSRNTAPAVGVAAAAVARRDKDAVIVVLPTDHYIRNEAGQLKAIAAAADLLSRRKGAIVVFGIHPTFPSTEFGYIKLRTARKQKAQEAVRAERFVEKPDLMTARKYLKSGRYLWNSGAFCFTAETLLRAMRKNAPAVYRNLRGRGSLAARYARMPDISLDYAVMEKARNIYCIPGSYGWNDVGSFKALKKVLRREKRRFVESDGKIVRILP